MSQSKGMSWAESLANVVAGYFLSFSIQIVIFRHFGMPNMVAESALIAVLFMCLSFVRLYIIRRLFNSAGHSQ